MHVLKVHTSDIYDPLGRLMDRIRLADLPIAALEARSDGAGYAVAVRMATDDHATVERIAHQVRQTIGAFFVEIDCACAQSAGARYIHNAGAIDSGLAT